MNEPKTCTDLLLKILPFIEDLAPVNSEAALLRDQVQAFFDNQSKPLRDAIVAWGLAHDVCFVSGWYKDVRLWRFDSKGVEITIDENGTFARVNGERVGSRRTTPRALKMRLTNWLRGRRPSLAQEP